MSSFYIDPPFVHLWNRKNKAFQAQYEKVVVRKLPDGQISQQIKTGVIYRDAYGRTRREERSDSEVAPSNFSHTIMMSDPTTQELCFLDVESKTVLRSPFSDDPQSDQMQETDDILEDAASKNTALGEQLIEGLVCFGYRVNQPQGGAVEYWISKELLDVMLAKSVDVDKESTLRLFDIRPDEPDCNLFIVPADYEDEDEEEYF